MCLRAGRPSTWHWLLPTPSTRYPRTLLQLREWLRQRTSNAVSTLRHAPSSASELAASVREQAWSYLTAAAAPLQVASVAEDLFRLPRGDLRRLAAAYVGTSPEAGGMLDAAEQVLRELP